MQSLGKALPVIAYAALLAAMATISGVTVAEAHAGQVSEAGKSVLVLKLCVYAKTAHEGRDSAGYAEPVAKGVGDSVKDIAHLLAADPTLNLVKKPQDADVSLEIVSRGTRKVDGTSGFIIPNGFGGFMTGTFRDVRRVLFVNLKAPGYTKPMIGRSSSGLWTDAAQDLVNQAMKWINLNREAILSRHPL